MHQQQKNRTSAMTTVVLDTNVCLDLFVFHDPRWASLLAALKDGVVQAITRHDCRIEWLRVLDYPNLPLNPASKAESAQRFDQLITCVDPAPRNHLALPLPLCSDKDDQKFLELARDAQVDFLITKDKALLKLAKKTARDHAFRIILPEAWVPSHLAPSSPNALVGGPVTFS